MMLHVDRGSRVPLYEQIAEQLRTLILSQALAGGHRLPSTRALAEMLSVNRKTVVEAYRMLRVEGLVVGQGRGGTVVRSAVPTPVIGARPRPVLWRQQFTESTKPAFISSDRFYRQLIKTVPKISLGMGREVGLHRLGNPQLLHDAWEQVMRDIDTSGLTGSSVRGFGPLRDLLTRRAALHGIDTAMDCTMLTDNSTQSTLLLSLALLNRGDSVALEIPCLSSILHVYELLGIQIQAVPMDDQGADLQVLEGVLTHAKPKLIHVFPTHRIPTATSMSLQRRKDLVALAGRYRVPILEMPEYGSYHYEGEAIPSISSLDPQFQTIFATTLEYELPMGLRIAWLVAPAHVIRAIVPIKHAIEPSTHPIMQALAYHILTHPGYSVDALREQGQRERDYMLSLLDKHCSSSLVYDRPIGGLNIWAEARPHVDLSARAEALAAYWQFCLPGYFYYPGMRGGERNLSFFYGACDPDYVTEVVASIGRILA